MSRKKTQNKTNSILNRISNHYYLENDAAIGAFYGVSESTVSAWRTRDSINETLIRAKCNDDNLANWFINGVKTQESEKECTSASETSYNSNIYSCTEKSFLLHQQLEHICRDGSEKQINAVAAILEGTEQSIMQFEAIMAEMLKLSKKIDQLETTLKSERRIPGAASQDNQTRRNAK